MNIAAHEPKDTIVEKEVNIKVCDAIMGSGKTTAAINYMNAHTHERFIYVAPFLTENSRIDQACPKLHFSLPREDKKLFLTKTKDLKALLRSRKNIAMSHELFGLCDDEISELTQAHGYHLIIDEVVDALNPFKTPSSNLNILNRFNALKFNEDSTIDINVDLVDELKKSSLSEIASHAASHKLVCSKDKKFLYWLVSDRMLRACKEVIIMTYMFQRSAMCAYLKLCGLTYSNLYIAIDKNGRYQFSKNMQYMPEYAARLSSLITIVDNDAMNKVGQRYNSLSHNWYKKNVERCRKNLQRVANGEKLTADEKKKDFVGILRKNLRSFYDYRYGKVTSDDFMWTCFTKEKDVFIQRGLNRNFLSFNTKGINDYANRHYLAYMVNVYLLRPVKQYFNEHDIDVNDDDYALCCMIQWIWRSAIRNGEPITLYLPSSRMRKLLTQWMEEVESTYAAFKQMNQNERTDDNEKEPVF